MRTLPICLLASAAATAQGDWSFVNSTTVPHAACRALAFDSTRAVIVAVGGSSSAVQAWERAGGDWSLRGLSNLTSVGIHNAVVFDSARGVTLALAGGGSPDVGGSALSEWSGALWLPLSASLDPAYRTRHAMAYDTARGTTVLFGGLHMMSNTLSVFGDTWTYDGTTWTKRLPVSSPVARGGHAMAYDSARGRVILFGGTTAGAEAQNRPPEEFYGDTWEWDGTTWFERTNHSGDPPARHEHAMAYDPIARVTYLFGGLDASGTPLNDFWAFDGTTWTRIVTSSVPARRFDCGLAFDAARGKLVLYGGQNSSWAQYRNYGWNSSTLRDTWEYTPGVVGAFSTFGNGCAGSRGAPALRLQGAPPTAGRTLHIQIDNLPLAGAVFAFLGASSTQYGSLSLPLPLGSLGMNGCTLYSSGDVLVGVTNVLGTALLTVDVPRNMVGSSLFVQAFPLDPGANLLGLTASHGGHVQVGG